MKKIVIANSKGGCGKSTLTLSLADLLPDAQIIDMDHQGSITQAADFTGRHNPVHLQAANGKFVIFDTPPYLSEELPSLLASADIILVPTRIGEYDLLAIGGIIDRIREVKKQEQASIVFNAVPSRKTNSLKKSRKYFLSNYQDIRKANTELNTYEGFRTIATKPIFGAAKKQIELLIQEINL